MPENNILNNYSEELQDIMGQIPNKIIRQGIVVIFFILCCLLIGSCFFKYPDIINVPITLTTKNPPVSLISKSTGKIEHLFFQNEQQVNQDDIVACLSNATNYEDYVFLKLQLNKSYTINNWSKNVLEYDLPEFLVLGEIQVQYSSFLKMRMDFKEYLNQNFIPKKIELLRNRISKQKEYYSSQIKQKNILLKDLDISEESFRNDSILFQKKVISADELRDSRQKYLMKESSYISFNTSIKQTETSFLQMDENILEMQMQYEKELSMYYTSLDEAKLNLDNIIHQWEEKYLIISPIKGKISFTDIWNKNQQVNIGDIIGTVVPEGETAIIVKAIVPATGLGKIDIGQQVNIKLAGFPYMEYGMLKGQIQSVSLVPEKGNYFADIKLNQGMLSSYNEKIKFIHQMNGTAEIITDDLPLIYRFINPLRALIDKNNF